MPKLARYIKNYRPVEGPKMYYRLKWEAALASAHARQKKRLGI